MMNVLLGLLMLVLVPLASEVIRLEFSSTEIGCDGVLLQGGYSNGTGVGPGRPGGNGRRRPLVCAFGLRKAGGRPDAGCRGHHGGHGGFGCLHGRLDAAMAHRGCVGAVEHRKHGEPVFEQAAAS